MAVPNQLPKVGVSIVSDEGTGRVFVTILDDLAYLPLAQGLAASLREKARSVLVMSAPVATDTWESLSESLAELMPSLGMKQASLIGFGAAATLAQNLALCQPKLVRTLAVIDSSTRPHPTRWERLVDHLEERLPFGLPLRLGSQGFNIKSYVHRLRCPLLVVGTPKASSFIRAELKSLAALAPTAWEAWIAGESAEAESHSLTATLLAFQDVPAKCPQKRSAIAV